MRRLAIAAATAILLSGCASTQRLGSYNDGDLTAEAQIMVQGKRMNVSVHPRDDTLLAQTTVGDAAVGGLLEGATFGIARGFRPDPREIDRSLAAFVAPVGCTVAPVGAVGGQGVAYEGRYTCPSGVDLRQLMRAQKADLMRGQPIHR